MTVRDDEILASGNAVAVIGAACELLRVNPAFLKLWRYAQDSDIVGRHLPDLCQESDHARRICRGVMEEGGGVRELVGVRGDGSSFDVRLTIRPMPGKTATSVLFLVSFADTSAAGRAEMRLQDAERRFRSIFNASRDPMVLVSPDGRVQSANPITETITGWSADELVDQEFAGFLHPDYVQPAVESFRRAVNGEHPSLLEVQFRSKSGAMLFSEVLLAPQSDDGTVTGVLCILRDVTDRRTAETEKRNMALLVENSPDYTSLATLDGRLLYINQSGQKLLGLEEDQVQTKSVFDIVSPESMSLLNEKILPELMQTGRWRGELFYRHQTTGTSVPFEAIGFIVPDAVSGKAVGLATVSRDISDRKKAEEQIHKLTRTYKVLSNINQLIVRVRGLETVLNEACRIAVEDGGFTMAWIGLLNATSGKVDIAASYGDRESYLAGMDIDVTVDERSKGPTGRAIKNGEYQVCNDIEHDPAMESWHRSAARSGFRSSAAFPLLVSGGIRGTLNLYADRVDYFDEEELKLLQELAMDVSFAIEFDERTAVQQRAENERRMSEAKYRRLFESMTDSFVETSLDGRFVEVNNSFLRLTGYSKDEMLEHKFLDLVPPSCHESARGIVENQVLPNGYSDVFETEIATSNGSTVSVEVRGYLTRDDQGLPQGFWAIIRDIRERKRAELELRSREELLQASVRVADIGIFDHDHAKGTIYWSPRQREIHGVGMDEPISLQTFFNQVHPEDRERVALSVEAAHDPNGDGLWNTEHRIVRPNGGVRWLASRSQTYFAGEGSERRPVRTVGAVLDITQRKQVEAELQLSEARLKRAEKLARIGHFSFDADGTNIAFSDGFAEIWGIEPGSPLTFEASFARLHPDDREHVEKEFEHLIELKKAFDLEYRIVRSDGSVVVVHSVAEPMASEGPGPARYFGTLIDVTERRRAENAIRSSEARLSEAQRIAQLGNWDWELKTDTLYWSDETFRIFGYEPNQLHVSFDLYQQRIHPADVELVLDSIDQSLNQDEPYSISHRIVLPTGEIRHIHAEGVILRGEEDEPLRMYGTVQDVTESTLAQQRLLASLEEKEVLLRELYHRTKNNMQVISAIISMQSMKVSDDSARAVFRDTQDRIQAMALVHQKLYQSQDLSSIGLKEYVEDLASLLVSSYEKSRNNVRVRVDAEDITVLLDIAIPCGLILNELLSNSLKHAFPDDRKGNITISFMPGEVDEIELVYRDDGIGVPEDFDFRKQETFGLQSIFLIAEHQLQGRADFKSENGVSFHARFKNSLYSPRV